jgi:membrane-associated phospholipid phosphatase
MGKPTGMAAVHAADLAEQNSISTQGAMAFGARARTVPVLEPRPGGVADRFSQRVGAERPILAFVSTLVLGYVALAGFMILLGLLLTDVLLPIGGFSNWDEGVNEWLADRRNHTLEHLSWVGSTLAGGLVIPVVVGFFLVVFVVLRHWRLAAFTLFVILVESGAYRATTLVVHRERPSVHRLESLPVDASFPSGHTAASLALYGGLLLLLVSRVRWPLLTGIAVVVALAIPVFVAWSRMYRGMHHLTDSAAGVLLGIGALVVTIFAARVAGAAADRRGGRVFLPAEHSRR